MVYPSSTDNTYIFVSYRRNDGAGDAARLLERLQAHYGKAQVFMDLGSIGAGAEFGKVIDDALAKSTILIAMIGHHWLPAIKTKRLFRWRSRNKDWVVFEITKALEREIPVIPTLMHGAKMPNASQLPKDLKPLSALHALSLDITHWNSDVDALINRLDQLLDERKKAQHEWEQDTEARKVHEHETRAAAAQQGHNELQAERLHTKRLIEKLKGRLISLVLLALTVGGVYKLSAFAPDAVKRFVNRRVGDVFAVASPSPQKTTTGDINSLRLSPVLKLPAAPSPCPDKSVNTRSGIELCWIDPDESGTPRTLNRGFYIASTEVTRAQWKTVMGTNAGSALETFYESADSPATPSRKEAKDFIQKLEQTEIGNPTYRLPTRSELEYACSIMNIAYSSCLKASSDLNGNFSSGFRVATTDAPVVFKFDSKLLQGLGSKSLFKE